MKGWAKNRAGFTLVELLAVLAIIAVLMGIVSSAVAGAKRNARCTRTRETARQLVTAWSAYLVDARAFPDVSKFHDAEDGEFFKASAYNIGALLNTTYNSKGVAYADSKIYFETSETECERSGTAPNFKFAGTGVLDDWKEPLIFTLDFDLDGLVENPVKQGEMVRSRALVYSRAGMPAGKEKAKSKYIVVP